MSKIEQRVIKFRAWDRTKNQWFYPPDKMDSHLGDFSMTGDGRVYIDGQYQDLTLCQFTGLYDQDKQKIYEGDICEAFKPNSYLDGIYEVAWHQEKGRWYYKNQPDYRKLYQVGCTGNLTCRIVGNIFQNGDLLNVKD
jgi:uncharacterized phage protein (TIGR01671 family)